MLAEQQDGKKPVVAIGQDTRISGGMLEGALVAGLCAAGADVLRMGVLPTPAVARLTIQYGADAGVVISASHNPFAYNGIKIFDGKGFKLSDELEERVEQLVLSGTDVPEKTGQDIGKVIECGAECVNLYLNYLVSTVEEDLSSLKVLVDCANGASSVTADRLFHKLNMKVDIIHDDPDGVNINDHCGSTHLESLSAMVKAGGYDCGIAFDGDADRCLAVDEEGVLIDGDQILAVCGAALRERGMLPGDALVATVMSNMGFRTYCKEQGFQLVCTDVGDRHVLEEMEAKGYTLGGEQSGHTIFRAYATTGDGELTALQFLQVLKRSGMRASQLVAPCPRYPQVLINAPVKDQEEKNAVIHWSGLGDAVAEEEKFLAGKGRTLIRPSGTEALVRVMVEAEFRENAEKSANRLVDVIKRHLNLC